MMARRIYTAAIMTNPVWFHRVRRVHTVRHVGSVAAPVHKQVYQEWTVFVIIQIQVHQRDVDSTLP